MLPEHICASCSSHKLNCKDFPWNCFEWFRHSPFRCLPWSLPQVRLLGGISSRKRCVITRSSALPNQRLGRMVASARSGKSHRRQGVGKCRVPPRNNKQRRRIHVVPECWRRIAFCPTQRQSSARRHDRADASPLRQQYLRTAHGDHLRERLDGSDVDREQLLRQRHRDGYSAPNLRSIHEQSWNIFFLLNLLHQVVASGVEPKAVPALPF